MATFPLNKIVLFEYDEPIDITQFLNTEAGIWSWTMTNTVITVDDDNGNTGYYEYQQSIKYNIKSVVVDKVAYAATFNMADLRITNKSFYYDTDTTKLHIHFDNSEPPLSQEIFFGAAIGFSKMPNNEDGPYFNNIYYEPRLSSIPNLSKSIDPLFFGLLKYATGSVVLINSDGALDDWRSRNLFGQPARILIGDVGNDYTTFEKVMEGFISDDERDFDTFKIAIEDPRRALTQPVASNILTLADWPTIDTSNLNIVKPVAYGTIKNASSICLNEAAIGPIEYTFLMCDTEFNVVSSLDNIYVDEVLTALSGAVDLNAGTFTMTVASVSDPSKVFIDFTATTFDNGVDVIKDLMLNYDGKTFIDSFWDTTEVDSAELQSRDTSLYVNEGNKKLSEVIESVANDADIRFFAKNSGLYTIRVYDNDRTPNGKELINDERLNNPKIMNNGSEYLSSAIIEYSVNVETSKGLLYENTDYQQEAFDRYKKLKAQTFKTNLPTLADAMDKSETIMNISKEVQDIVERAFSWDNFGVEPTDFIIGSPTSRLSEDDIRGIYEVLSVKSDLNNFSLQLKLRFIEAAAALPVYATIDDNNDFAILDNNNTAIVGRIS